MAAKRAAPKGKVILLTPRLTFREVENGLYLEPTREGREEAKEALEREPRRGILVEEGDMLEWALGNGWSMVPPENIGALTDATIISEDGFLGDDGVWYAHPDAKHPRVFAHMNYQVEDPTETWAAGKAVFYVKEPLTLSPEYRRKAEKKLKEVSG
jgi:hypothetical protein